jgi:MoaA/NifB/PqqE/SkfB family radical SAM enzyme
MKRENEMTLEEWDKTLASLGKAPYWFTISGGEPFLNNEIVELAQSAYEHCRPGIINIPTNSILKVIPGRVAAICESCPDSQIIINLSLDGVGEKHDFIRGVANNFEKFERTLNALLELRDKYDNLNLGIHTVLSTFNVKDLNEIIEYVETTGVDQFITEIAEPRVELDTIGLPITPDREAYAKAVNRLGEYVRSRTYRGMSRITEAFRLEYYNLVQRILAEEDQVIPCYAGWASCQIYADGTVWPCCIRADDLGNLRDFDYDFKAIWFGEKIKEVRRSIAAKECNCPLANAAYTNMLHDVPTLIRVSTNILSLSENDKSKPKPQNIKRKEMDHAA